MCESKSEHECEVMPEWMETYLQRYLSDSDGELLARFTAAALTGLCADGSLAADSLGSLAVGLATDTLTAFEKMLERRDEKTPPTD